MAANLRSPDTLILYSSPTSGCSARVRIAARLKGLPLEIRTIDLLAGGQKSAEYKRINPNCSVPTLVAEHKEKGQEKSVTITQSLAILQYLEDAFPNTNPLIPRDPAIAEKAMVLQLCTLVIADIQPLQSLRLRAEIERLGGDVPQYVSWAISRGFDVYEDLLSRNDSRSEHVSVGKDVSLADVCLVPMVQKAHKEGIDISKWPSIRAITKACLEKEAFKEGGFPGIEVP